MPTGPGDILDLIRHGRAPTRGDVLEATGLSRMTVAQRLDALLAAGMIVEGETTEATGGRRRRSLAFNTSQSRVARRRGRHHAHPDRRHRPRRRGAGRGPRSTCRSTSGPVEVLDRIAAAHGRAARASTT